VIKEHIHDIITVDETEIIKATFMIWKTLKIFVEVSSATVLAGIIKENPRFYGKKVALVLSGGNVDFNVLAKYHELY
jgi:threonine dehydratase